MRKIQLSVTNFIHHGDEYLFLKRNLSKKIDPGMLNGVGGKVDPHEDYMTALVRETQEETGLIVSPQQVRLCGVVRLEGGYEEDWVMCFFKTIVPDKQVPHGTHTSDGELLWIHKDDVLGHAERLVDDIHYCFDDIVEAKSIFFMSADVSEDHKIIKTSVKKLRQ